MKILDENVCASVHSYACRIHGMFIVPWPKLSCTIENSLQVQRSAHWLQDLTIAITFQWWKIIDGNRNRDGIAWPMTMTMTMATNRHRYERTIAKQKNDTTDIDINIDNGKAFALMSNEMKSDRGDSFCAFQHIPWIIRSDFSCGLAAFSFHYKNK